MARALDDTVLPIIGAGLDDHDVRAVANTECGGNHAVPNGGRRPGVARVCVWRDVRHPCRRLFGRRLVEADAERFVLVCWRAWRWHPAVGPPWGVDEREPQHTRLCP
eukprot:scaffold152634_cov31-Tisochrysis_lutea.AAC.6